MLIEKLSTILMKINDKFFVLSKKINCLVKINNKSYLPPLIYYNNNNNNNNYSNDLKYLKKNKNEFQFLINLSGFIRPYSTKSSSSNETDSTDKLTINDIPELNIEHYKDGIILAQLNRSQGKNSLSKKLLNEIDNFLVSIKEDKNVRCIIISSLVPGVFCAGADLKERSKMKLEEVGPFVSRTRQLFDEIARLPVPVICALDGVALGGGLEMALACDFRIAASNTKLGLVETKLAIIPGAGGTQRLPRLIGVSKAKELIYTGRTLDGDQAKQIGLVNESVKQNSEGNAAFKHALDLAEEISQNGPIAVKLAKQVIDGGIETDMQSALKLEEKCYSKVIPTKDRIEGLNAFKEKRQPKYTGN